MRSSPVFMLLSSLVFVVCSITASAEVKNRLLADRGIERLTINETIGCEVGLAEGIHVIDATVYEYSEATRNDILFFFGRKPTAEPNGFSKRSVWSKGHRMRPCIYPWGNEGIFLDRGRTSILAQWMISYAGV